MLLDEYVHWNNLNEIIRLFNCNKIKKSDIMKKNSDGCTLFSSACSHGY